tara:strand:- start:1588 stop:1965 length:378 start_codon:yes stop_codon:yes gene_type:complete
MTVMKRKWVQIYFTTMTLFLLACIYYTYLVVATGSMHPDVIYAEMMDTTTQFGPWAFALDFIFLGLMGWWIKRKLARKKKVEESIWETSDGLIPGLLMDLEPVYLPPPPSPKELELLSVLQDENL